MDSRLRRVVSSFLMLLASTNGACSFLFVDKPPDNHRELASFDCSEGRGWPVTDVVMGGIYALTSVVGAVNDEGGDTEEQRVGLVLTFAGLSALHGVSAFYGFNGVSKCRHAKRDLEARHGMPVSAARGTSATPARVVTRGGQIVEGRVLGQVLIAPDTTVHGEESTMSFAVVDGADIGFVDSKGVTLWKYPQPEVRVWVVANQGGLPLDLPQALAILATGSTVGSGTNLVIQGRAHELQPGRFVAGELIFSGDGKTLELVRSIRVDTGRNVVSIPVGDLPDAATGSQGLVASTDSSPAPAAAAGPPAASDWTTEYRGMGGLTVTVNNGATISVFVKIRDRKSGTTAAQVLVAAGQSTTVRLGSGEFEVLMRAEMAGGYRYFKGRAIAVPANTTGTAVLSVGLPGGGEGLEEIDGAEFNR